MNRTGLILILLVSIILGDSLRDTVTWSIVVEPPITYKEGGELKGYGAEILKVIQRKLPDYDHEVVIAGNYKRSSLLVQTGPLTAALGLFKNEERLKTMHFSSVPVFSFFDMQIAMRRSTFVQLGEPAEVSLESLLTSLNLKLGVSHGRKYSGEIQTIIDLHSTDQNTFIGAQGNVAKSLLGMLLLERIDYMLLYPDEAQYLRKKLDAEGDIVTIPISESNTFGHAWAVTTQNEKGAELILQITEILREIRQNEWYHMLYEQWISPNLVEMYRTNFRNSFLSIEE